MPRITITVSGLAPQPYRFGLDRDSVTMGRDAENDVFIDCGSVSLKHAVMQRVSGGYELRDLGSTNGIRLNGQYQDVIELRNGQSVLLGDVGFEFLLSDEELAALSAEEARGPSTTILQGATHQQAVVDPASVLPPMPEPKVVEPMAAPQMPEPKVVESVVAPQMPEPKVVAAVVEPEMPEPMQGKVRQSVESRVHPEMPEPQEARAEPLPVDPIRPGASLVIPKKQSNTKLAVILAIIAFLVGMELHHRAETGKSLFGEFQRRLTGGE